MSTRNEKGARSRSRILICRWHLINILMGHLLSGSSAFLNEPMTSAKIFQIDLCDQWYDRITVRGF